MVPLVQPVLFDGQTGCLMRMKLLATSPSRSAELLARVRLPSMMMSFSAAMVSWPE